jgi:hypothetical protein
MPQIAKGGKFVFGWSVISMEGYVRIPKMPFNEYRLHTDKNVILISGSKKSGGFCVSNYTLMRDSIMNGLFVDHPEMKNYSAREGACITYKGRSYCWLRISPEGIIKLPGDTMQIFEVKPGDKLLLIRGSDKGLALTAKGPLVKAADNYKGVIEVYNCQGYGYMML